jgi:hypothetical protein
MSRLIFHIRPNERTKLLFGVAFGFLHVAIQWAKTAVDFVAVHIGQREQFGLICFTLVSCC